MKVVSPILADMREGKMPVSRFAQRFVATLAGDWRDWRDWRDLQDLRDLRDLQDLQVSLLTQEVSLISRTRLSAGEVPHA